MASSRLERIGTIFTRVEGLLKKGGLKPDDRPIWFDVYKAFPPITEPKFARPLPEIKPIRHILYREDAVRAKFHSEGHGLAAVNMFNPGETQTKKLLNQYATLKSQGVSDEEAIAKSVEAVGLERQQAQETFRAEKSVANKVNPKSVAGQVLSDANLGDIFKEEK